jgi:hypothetical protein
MVDYAAIKLQSDAIQSMTNDVSGRPFVMVFGTTMAAASVGAPYTAMRSLGPSFRSLGLNTTCIVWVRDSQPRAGYPGDQIKQCNEGETRAVDGVVMGGGTWKVLTLTSKNATSVEMLVNHIHSVGKAGVLYMDAMGTTGNVSVDLVPAPASPRPWPGSLLSEMLFPESSMTEDMIFFRSKTDAEAASGYAADLMMPHVPMVETSMFLAWDTPMSSALFNDAAEWSHSIEVSKLNRSSATTFVSMQQQQQQQQPSSPAAQYTQFIVNSLLNRDAGTARDVRLMDREDLPYPVSEGFPRAECDADASICCKNWV